MDNLPVESEYDPAGHAVQLEAPVTHEKQFRQPTRLLPFLVPSGAKSGEASWEIKSWDCHEQSKRCEWLDGYPKRLLIFISHSALVTGPLYWSGWQSLTALRPYSDQSGVIGGDTCVHMKTTHQQHCRIRCYTACRYLHLHSQCAKTGWSPNARILSISNIHSIFLTFEPEYTNYLDFDGVALFNVKGWSWRACKVCEYGATLARWPTRNSDLRCRQRCHRDQLHLCDMFDYDIWTCLVIVPSAPPMLRAKIESKRFNPCSYGRHFI